MSSTGQQNYVTDVPAAITALLAATKRLEEVIKQWGHLYVTEQSVSDAYVKVGNEFHKTVAALKYYRVDTSDISTFPDELRKVLEECLGFEPTPQNVQYLKVQVKGLIAKLLVSLKSKQSAYWQCVYDRQGRNGGY